MTNKFVELGISVELEKRLEMDRITEPTPIQQESIPVILKGRDVLGQAHTGTGKTLAFLLPIMEEIDVNKPEIQSLIITPTRELALQITQEAKKLAEIKGASILSVYGGQDVERQLHKLSKGVNVVIGTPGRILDHINRGTINLSQVKILVLDEADEMLQMGFKDDLETIVKRVSKVHQTLLFSATIPKQVKALSAKFMKNPVQIHVQKEKVTLDEIEQIVVDTTDRGKFDTLCKLIDEERPFMAIIFCRTKRRVKELSTDLAARGYNCDELHGDLSQAKREKVVRSLKEMKLQLLVATDLAARGLDIEGISHIFNYDMPEETESYIHRIGRTGRAGHTGKAYTFATARDKGEITAIQNKIQRNLKTVQGETTNSKGNKPKPKTEKKEKYNWKKASEKKSPIRNVDKKRKAKKK